MSYHPACRFKRSDFLTMEESLPDNVRYVYGNETYNFSGIGNETIYIDGISFVVSETYHLPMDVVTLVLAIIGWIFIEITCKGNIRNTYRIKTIMLVLRSSLRIVASRLKPHLYFILFAYNFFSKFDSLLLVIIQMISVSFLNILYKCTCDFEKGDGKNNIVKKVSLCVLSVMIFKVCEEVFFRFFANNFISSATSAVPAVQPLESIISCVSTFYCCYSGAHIIHSISGNNEFVSRACPRLKMRNLYLRTIATSVVISQVLLFVVNLIDRAILSVHEEGMFQCLRQNEFAKLNGELDQLVVGCGLDYLENVDWLEYVDPTWATLIEMIIIIAVSLYKFIKKL